MSTLNETRSIVNSELLSMLEDAFKEGFRKGHLAGGYYSKELRDRNWLASATRVTLQIPTQEQLREG